MKHFILICFCAILASAATAQPAWVYSSNLESTDIDVASRSFIEVDSNGRLWCCRYDLGGVDVFNQDGTRPFGLSGPITTAKDASGTDIPVENPSGLAIHNGFVYVSLDDQTGDVYTGIVRFNESDGTPLNGWDLTWRPSDIDINSINQVIVGVKVEGTVRLMDLSGSEIFTYSTGQKLVRGVCWSNDGNTIYVCGEENPWVTDSSDYFGKFVSSDGFTNFSVISTSIVGPEAIDVDSDDYVYVSETSPGYSPSYIDPPHHIYIYDDSDTLVSSLNDSALDRPCGIAIYAPTPENTAMYVSLSNSYNYFPKYIPPTTAVCIPWNLFE